MRTLTAIVLTTHVLSAAPARAPQAVNAATKFEVVSIRRNQGTGLGRINTEPGGRFLVINFPLVDVIETAYGIRPFQLVDVPRWVEVEKFDILARTGRDDYLSVVAMRPMIQTLLAERFRLEVGREQRVMQTYALTRMRSDTLGPQLTSSKADCRSRESRDPSINPLGCGLRTPDVGTMIGVGSSSLALAYTLTAFLGTFVDDETGLTGSLDFSLKWNPGLSDDPGATPDRVSIFTAVQEQLGLKLEPRRKAVDVIAIKRIERPTEN